MQTTNQIPNQITSGNNVISPFAAQANLRLLTGAAFPCKTASEFFLRFEGPDGFSVELRSSNGQRFGFEVARNGRRLATGARRFKFDGAVTAAAEQLARLMDEFYVAEERGGFRLMETGGLYCPTCAAACGGETGERFDGEGICCNCGLSTDGTQVPGQAGYHVWIADDNAAAKAEAELATFCAVEAAENLEAVMVLKAKLAEKERQIARLIRERDEAQRIGMEQNQKRVEAEQKLTAVLRAVNGD